MRIVSRTILSVLVATMLALGGLVQAAAQTMPAQPQVDVNALLQDLPDGGRWLDHLNQDLLPFWTMPEALGKPVGNYPTYRCNDGHLFDPAKPCQELADPDPSVKGIIKLDRDYTRMKNRQAYAYGIAYHMTGNPEYLRLAKAGSDWLRQYALERKNGKIVGAYTYFKEPDRKTGPASTQRTSQDLAYAATGIGFYYYLTRDPAVLKDVVALKDYIFQTYYDAGRDILTWVKEPSPDGDKTDQLELVAQLDQVYAYMMWLTPALPEPLRAQWKKDLQHLAYIMIGQFFTPREDMMWGAITSTATRRLGTDHTDFGHTVKTLWLIYEIGKLNNDIALIDFGRVHAAQILEHAYVERTGSWARRFDAQGKLDENKEWWILCELDQVAGTLGLLDPGYARYLPKTYDYYFKHMVDHENHEVWHWVNAADDQPNRRIPKQHSWKNSLHSFEHALVGYLVGQQLHAKPVTLYFAFSQLPSVDRITPYFFQGKVDATKRTGSGYQVTFTNLR
jgi:mannose/cellobiose epimerase-like protein (N-acyl-D-glucosamine 2-epimerase family)